MPLPPGDEHVMAERDVQEVVAQRSAASRSSKNAVGVKFLAAKLMPFIVTVAPLSVGMLIDETAERIGESYVKADLRVPTMAPTVRIKGTLDPYDAPSVLHDNEEYVSHDVVSHGTSAVCAVVLESNAPKSAECGSHFAKTSRRMPERARGRGCDGRPDGGMGKR